MFLITSCYLRAFSCIISFDLIFGIARLVNCGRILRMFVSIDGKLIFEFSELIYMVMVLNEVGVREDCFKKLIYAIGHQMCEKLEYYSISTLV